MSHWICCQIGAREHYAIPRALHEIGQLAYLITDAWVSPSSPFKYFPKGRLKERFHPALSSDKVRAFNTSLLGFELIQKFQKTQDWDTIINRNQWFQKQTIKMLKKLAPSFQQTPILFSYSYAALELFRFAKQQGWLTVLGQIDPGIFEEKIVTQLYTRYSQYGTDWQPAPQSYWQNWQEECQLADVIMVNSQWSRQLLEQAGVDPQKLHLIPLVYTPPAIAENWNRIYPVEFNHQRPLRVLFLGQVILRKGIAALLEAIKLLEGYPIEFWIVGPQQITIPPDFQYHDKIHWVAQVNRSKTAYYYQLADVFLFPTHSDGFGLTQLEAQAWQLPIIASSFCGEVVQPDLNGLVLSEITGKAIADSLLSCFHSPQQLAKFSQQAMNSSIFSLFHLQDCLKNIF
ncbi:MAG: glycosyltransferase family 4 protein [Snowella sp.]|nr:glycosyltransferase family 4 protein [Snowella sp.]